ncbi:lanthionine synthetase C family protein [Sinosporangium siamense]|uniref:lanthionine synthetase C family protein n=1 Tax=Sinosporangium siamense TaxID=1367973 RepID=UPI0035A25D2D
MARYSAEVTEIATRLSFPASTQEGHPQSLSRGAVGVALLHVERAASGVGDWETAHRWLTAAATAMPISTGPQAGLLFGAPALAFTLHAAADRPGRYERALASLDTQLDAITRRHLDRAHERIDCGRQPHPKEFDLFRGLTGLGAHLLRRNPGGDLIRQVLAYLVRLSEDLDAQELPGWWVDCPPTGGRTTDRLGGHGDFGMAHGISAPLTLLSLAARRGIVVDGQVAAIGKICSWTDAWLQEGESGPWWPETVTVDEVARGRPEQKRPRRPSWCYGTPGIARAQQLAGLATADLARQRMAESALLGCLNDPDQTRLINDHSLCHGSAGLFQTVWRFARDADHGDLTHWPQKLADRFLARRVQNMEIGLLFGSAGLGLALTTAAGHPPVSSWDSCLLLN